MAPPWRLLSSGFVDNTRLHCAAVRPFIGLAAGLKALHYAVSSLPHSSATLDAVSAINDESDDSPVPLVVMFSLASLQALSLAFSRLELRLPDIKLEKPWFRDDILYTIFSFLEPADAARAGLVCTRWHQNATHASYRSVTLHTSSPFSRSLAHTLLHHPELRRHVRHLTVLHCTPHPEAHLYEWVYLVRPHVLQTCRIFSVPGPTERLHSMCGLNAAHVETAFFGYKFPTPALLRNIADAENPARRQRLREMLAHDGHMMDRSQPYRAEVAAVAAPTPLRAAIERFSEGIRLETRGSAHRQMGVSIGGDRGVTRAEADAALEAMAKYVCSMPLFTVSLCGIPFDEDDEAAASAAAASDSDASVLEVKVEQDAVKRDMQYGKAQPCLCQSSASSGEPEYPELTVLTGCVGVAKTSFTMAAAKQILDRVWTGTVRDGGPGRIIHISCAYTGPWMPDAMEVCATCGLSLVRTFYLPCDARLITEMLGTV